jgi:hypothetical protein
MLMITAGLGSAIAQTGYDGGASALLPLTAMRKMAHSLPMNKRLTSTLEITKFIKLFDSSVHIISWNTKLN